MSPRVRQLDRALFGSVLAIALAAGTALFWPSIEQGLFADDYVAMAMLEGAFAAPRGPLDLFDFADGTRADVAAVQRLGSVPWWAPPDFRVSFMRPLSSLLWHVDRALFGSWLAGYHLHSIAAWMLLVVCAAALYRALLPAPIALLALPLFAIDHSLHFPTIWLSNRGGLYAIALGILGLLCHVRGRETADARRAVRLRVASACLFGVGLAFGEWAFPMLGYALAYELLQTSDSVRSRALALAPLALLGSLFLVLRAALGYGARGSGAYVDPGDETAAFLFAMLGRVPVFVADMLFNVPTSYWDHGSSWRNWALQLELISPRLWTRLPEWRAFHFAIGIAACALLAAVVRSSLRRLDAPQRARMKILLVGALFALVPVVGSFPSTRLTIAAFLGIAPWVALVIVQLAQRAFALAGKRVAGFALAYGAIVVILAAHLVHPLTEPIGPMIDNQRATGAWVARAPLDRARVADQHVYLLTSAEFTTTFFFAYIWAAHGGPMPRSVMPLIAAPVALDIARTGDKTLAIRTLGGPLLSSSQEHMFRASSLSARVKQQMRAQGITVTILRTIGGEPYSVELAFERSLDAPSEVLLITTPRGFERFEPPPVGEEKRIPRAPGPSWPGLEHARLVEEIGPLPKALSFAPVSYVLGFDPDA
jgi:hypothetical protein